MSINLSALMKQRYDTAANWTAQNPTLLAGEIGIESDTKKWKVGTGATTWASLAYAIGGTYPIVNDDIAAGAEIAVSKLADGSARQLLQTDAAGTGVEWTSDVSIPGVLAVTAGTAALPGIAVSGYTNTGIYSPGADQLAIATGGTGRVFVDASGNLGHGVVPSTWGSPQKAIEFSGGSSLSFNTGAPQWYLNNNCYYNGTNWIYKTTAVVNQFVGNAAGGGFIWNNAPSGTAGNTITFTQAMTLSASGRLGIGTSSPGYALTVSDGTRVGFIQPSSGLNSVNFGVATNHPMVFVTNDQERARLDTSGRLGIGTSSPAQVLHLSRSTNVDTYIQSTNSLTSSYYGTSADGKALTWNAGAYPLVFGTSDTERARIDSSGRLLVGTSSARANIYNASYAPIFQVETTGTLTQRTASFTYNNGGTTGGGPVIQLITSRSSTAGGVTLVGTDDELGSVQYFGTNGTAPVAAAAITAFSDGTPSSTSMPGRLVFSTTPSGSTNPVERMRIDNIGTTTLTSAASTAPFIAKISSTEVARIDGGGRLLVGTSSSIGYGGLLQIVGGDTARPQIHRNINDQYPASIYLSKARGTASQSVSNADEIGQIGFIGYDGTGQIFAASIRCFVDGTPGANDMPGRLVFGTTADGAASPTGRMQIDNAGRSYIFSSGNGLLSTVTAAAGTTTTLFSGNHSSAGGFTGGTASVYIWSNGNIQNTNNSYGAISDVKLKENIVDANSQWDDVKAFRVRKYNFKQGQTHTQLGVVANEIELISPGLVTESPDRDDEGNDLGTVTKSVNYSVLYMKAVKALQEAMERIESLETRLSALEGT